MVVESVIDLTDPVQSEQADRILDAALALVARWGVGKTAVADVAKEAGCSRATLYRVFPGGKQQLFTALGHRELRAYGQAVAEAADSADDLLEALTRSLVVATRLVRDHDAAQFVLEHEPGYLLPFLGFRRMDVVFALASEHLAPHLERFVPADRARWLTEWVTRLFTSYLFHPDPRLDLADADEVRTVLDRYILPSFTTPTRSHAHVHQ